ncbi:hypothetical protein V8F20_001426 [Naviculisporaceae sp. PSN 640]
MAKGEATTFLSLNEDVKHHILSYLSKSDYHALCLVHSAIRCLAERYLYSSIDFTLKPVGDPNERRFVHLLPLLRTVLRRPELTNYIRAITYPEKWWHSSRLWSHPAPEWAILPDSPLQEAIAFVETTALPYTGSWIMGLRRGSVDAYLAVLLTQLPSLQRLSLGGDVFIQGDIIQSDSHATLLGLVLRSLLVPSYPSIPGAQPGSLVRLQSIHLVRFLHPYFEIPRIKVQNTNEVLPFFYLPAIKSVDLSFSVVLPSPDEFWPTGSPTPVPLAKLTSLTLRDLREPQLGRLLSITPNLQSLHWEWNLYDEGLSLAYNVPVVDMDLIMSALNHVKPTLTELNIRAQHRSLSHGSMISGGIIHVQNPGRARELANFPRLTKLAIPLGFITGFNLPLKADNEHFFPGGLPRTLEYLTLTDDLFPNNINDSRDGPAYLALVLPWLQNLRTYTPGFKRLHICFPIFVEEDDIADVPEGETSSDQEERYEGVLGEIDRLATCQGIELFTTSGVQDFPATEWYF